MVLVHGAWGDLRSFVRALPALSASHHVFAPSLREHWPNPWPASEEEAYAAYTVEAHARDVAALIERLGVAPVDLVGHSYGGAVAAALARARPDLVQRLVLVEPAIRSLLADIPGGSKLLADMAQPRPAWLARLRAGETPVSVMRSIIDGSRPGTLEALPADQRRIYLANARTTGPVVAHPAEELTFSCDDARALRMPVLLLEGEKTARQYHEIAVRFVACAPGTRHVVIPASGHTMPFDAPEAMSRAILEVH